MLMPIILPRFADCIVPLTLHATLASLALALNSTEMPGQQAALLRVLSFLVACGIAGVNCYWSDYRRRTNVLLQWKVDQLGMPGTVMI
jgi:hypothetical protein